MDFHHRPEQTDRSPARGIGEAQQRVSGVSDEVEESGSSEELAIAAETAEQVRTAAIAALPAQPSPDRSPRVFRGEAACGDRAGTGYSARHSEIASAPRARSLTRYAGGSDMTLVRHPSDESLLRLRRGILSAGPSLVVPAAHLELCSACRAQVKKFEGVGGAFLAEMAREPMRADAPRRALESLDQHPPPGPQGRSRDRCVVLISEWRFRPRCVTAELALGVWLGPGFRMELDHRSGKS